MKRKTRKSEIPLSVSAVRSLMKGPGPCRAGSCCARARLPKQAISTNFMAVTIKYFQCSCERKALNICLPYEKGEKCILKHTYTSFLLCSLPLYLYITRTHAHIHNRTHAHTRTRINFKIL